MISRLYLNPWALSPCFLPVYCKEGEWGCSWWGCLAASQGQPLTPINTHAQGTDSPSSRKIIRTKFNKTIKLPGTVRQTYWQPSCLHVSLLSPYPSVLLCSSDHLGLSISIPLVPSLYPHSKSSSIPGRSSPAFHNVSHDPGQWTHLVSEVTQSAVPLAP